MNYIKRVGLVLILLILTINPLSVFAVVHGDVELLKTVALKNKANFESLLTWKGEVFEERKSTTGDWKDYMLNNKCIFAYDRLQNAVRWNKEPQESRYIKHGELRIDISAKYNSAMFKDQYYYRYKGWQRPDETTYHLLVIGRPIIAKGMENHGLDPRFLMGDPSYRTVYDKLMDIINKANDPKSPEWYMKRNEDLVVLEQSSGDIETKRVYDLSAGGNLVEFYQKTSNAENAREYTYEEKSGVWILKSYKRKNITYRRNGDFSKSTRILNWSNSVVNVPFEEDEFAVEKLGLKHGDRVSDLRIDKGYIYEGTLLEPPPSPKTLIEEKLPDLKNLGINLSPVDVNDKKILICYFDIEQQPSRNCILKLSKRAKGLKAKDIVVVAVQASKIEKGKLDEWIKENEINFPVGMIEGDQEKTRFNWGVKSLPWLIITDKEHVVIAEGFGINELDEKIKK
jgi:hypothetical protein